MTQSFLGIRFWTGGVRDLLRDADAAGGLFTVPSAPSLAQMRTDLRLADAYRASDWAVVDGGYVATVLRVVFRRNFPRISGLQILQRLTGDPAKRAVPLHDRRVLWVVPNEEERERIDAYLDAQGFPAALRDWYHAPFYQTDEDFEDAALAAKVADFRPDWVVICIGGGRQEKLGWYLRRQADTIQDGKPASATPTRPNGPVILCTGGAIAFFTGGQAKIPTWADRTYLGWLFRVCQDPRTFLPRYWNAGWEFPRLLWEQRHGLFESAAANPASPDPPSQSRQSPCPTGHPAVPASIQSCGPRMLRVSCAIGSAALAACVLTLSWMPDPAMSQVKWIPQQLASWADVYHNARTAVPMLALGALAACWFILRSPRNPGPRFQWRPLLAIWSGLFALVLIAETGQLLLPHRTFDWRDLVWGGMGAGVGMAIAHATLAVAYRWLIRAPNPQPIPRHTS